MLEVQTLRITKHETTTNFVEQQQLHKICIIFNNYTASVATNKTAVTKKFLRIKHSYRLQQSFCLSKRNARPRYLMPEKK